MGISSLYPVLYQLSITEFKSIGVHFFYDQSTVRSLLHTMCSYTMFKPSKSSIMFRRTEHCVKTYFNEMFLQTEHTMFTE